MSQFQNAIPEIIWIFILYTIINLIGVSSAFLLDDNPYRHFATLDPNGKYQLEWLVDWNQKRVIFNVTVKTSGYIGFGLIRKAGEMTGADIVIGGVYPNGRSYFSDRHAISNQLPEVDPSQDWKLHSAWERGGQTFLSFSRAFDTCDQHHDLPITDDAITLLWAYGEMNDQVEYHLQNRGSYATYLLDPDLTPRSIDPSMEQKYIIESKGTEVFKMLSNMIIPEQDTIFWCTFMKVPTTTKHHIIGFNTVFPTTDLDRRHVHQLFLHRCHAPEGIDPVVLFEDATRSGGSECYFLSDPNPLPTQYCKETIYVWGVGGRAVFFPDHVGLPMSEEGNEYFVLQVHYDNPDFIPNLSVTVELDVYYTHNLRNNDAGLLQMGEQIPGSASVIIPPSSTDHIIISHCAPGCTKRILPDGGVRVFASLLQTHISGRGVRYLHHRGNQELSWISHDDNYNFNHQQLRILRQERKLLPGDHLMNRCVYDTTGKNGSVVVGGFSTGDEICAGYLYYYPRSPGFSLCSSDIRTESYWNLLGIQNTTWDESRRQMVITSPPQYLGLGIADYANNYIEWNVSTREALQWHHQFDPQVSQCPRNNDPTASDTDSSSQQLQFYALQGNKRFPPTNYGPPHEFIKSEAHVENPEYLSEHPRGIPRFRRPGQCSMKSVHSKRMWTSKGR